MAHRGAEEGHDRIPDVLVHDALAPHDDSDHHFEIVVQQVHELVGAQRLRDRREAADVREQHGEHPVLPDEQRLRVFDEAIDHGLGHVFLEDGAEVVLALARFHRPVPGHGRAEGIPFDLVVSLLELRGHQVEGVPEAARLVAVQHLDPPPQVSGGDDLGHGLRHVAQRSGQDPGEQQQGDARGDQGDRENHARTGDDLVDGAVEGVPPLADQKRPAEGLEASQVGHPVRPADLQGLPALGPLLGQVAQPPRFRGRKVELPGLHDHGPFRTDRQDQLGGAAQQAPGEGSDRGLRGLPERRVLLEAVLDQQSPLALGVAVQLLGLELQEPRGHGRDAVAGAQGAHHAREHQGGDDQRQDDQDDLAADVHNAFGFPGIQYRRVVPCFAPFSPFAKRRCAGPCPRPPGLTAPRAQPPGSGNRCCGSISRSLRPMY